MKVDLVFSFGADTCLKKCKDDEMLFETIQTFKRGEFMHLATKHCMCATHPVVAVCLYVYKIDEVISFGPMLCYFCSSTETFHVLNNSSFSDTHCRLILVCNGAPEASLFM